MASALRMRRQQQLWTAISSLLGPDSMIEPQMRGSTCDQRPRRVSSVEYREQAIWLFRVVTSPPPEYCQDEPGD